MGLVSWPEYDAVPDNRWAHISIPGLPSLSSFESRLESRKETVEWLMFRGGPNLREMRFVENYTTDNTVYRRCTAVTVPERMTKERRISCKSINAEQFWHT